MMGRLLHASCKSSLLLKARHVFSLHIVPALSADEAKDLHHGEEAEL